MVYNKIYPFSAIVGQEELKLALVLNAVNPLIGGLLIRGEKGTAKSTTVRALAGLLPEIRVIEGCAYSCDPDNPSQRCEECKKNDKNGRIISLRTRVVTLPLNATEDRVTGGIDFNLAVKKGVRVMQPGLLARAHRGILYIDEINLLDDHIVDIILDASASGENRVEREGISFRHPASFILVGTMNPEEGELRPQLLDRFGLCVEVAAETDMEKRILLTQRREEYDAEPSAFVELFKSENLTIAQQIIAARERLKSVKLPKHMRTFISELCTENNVAGHRADIVIEQAAKGFSAYHQRLEVTIDDIRKVAFLALSHRRRDPVPPPPPPPPPEDDQNQEDKPEEQNDENPTEEKEQEQQEGPQDQNNDETQKENQQIEEPQPDAGENSEEQITGKDPMEQIFEVGTTFKVKKIVSPKDRISRRGSGKRSRSRISQKQGRYIKSTSQRNTGDIALDATLRAAAPYQCRRSNGSGLAVCLKQEDIREKIREKRIGNFLLFVVDASGSMGARGRMVASKGAVMSLLLDAYQKRDRVAMVSFRKNEAFLNLPPTSSVEMASRLLKEMAVGGRTPLSAGLLKSFEMLRNEFSRDPTSRPIAIIITDGKSNVSLGEKKPVEEAFSFASKMARDERIRFIVVDTEENGLVCFGLAGKLAAAMNAQYFKIDDLKVDQLINIVKGNI